MIKKILVTAFAFLVSLLLVACDHLATNPNDFTNWLDSNDATDLNNDDVIDETDYSLFLLLNDYTLWLNSDDAADFNDDRVINEDDYVLYRLQNSYTYWLSSSEAADLNNDDIIDEDDYDLYLYPTISDYSMWRDTLDAMDLNDDQVVDEDDYAIYLTYLEFAGDYEITNFSYTGLANDYIGDYIFLVDFEDYLSDITITVDHAGQVSTTLSNALIDKLDYTYSIILEALSNMTITKLSASLVAIDTATTIDSLTVNFSLYLTPIEGGFSTSYTISAYETNPVMTFNLMKVS